MVIVMVIVAAIVGIVTVAAAGAAAEAKYTKTKDFLDSHFLPPLIFPGNLFQKPLDCPSCAS